jgi:hypothetical protein
MFCTCPPPLELWQVVRFNHLSHRAAALLLQAQRRKVGGTRAIRGTPAPAA